MGDRANFGFIARTGAPAVFLYAHSGGYEMMDTLAKAIAAAEPRWSDDGYATRIAISHIVGDYWPSETGFGIYVNETGDNEHSVPVVNWLSGTVSLYPYFIGEFHPESMNPKFVMDLEAFVKKFSKTPSYA